MKNHKNGFTLLNETAHTLDLVPFNTYVLYNYLGKNAHFTKGFKPCVKYDT